MARVGRRQTATYLLGRAGSLLPVSPRTPTRPTTTSRSQVCFNPAMILGVGVANEDSETGLSWGLLGCVRRTQGVHSAQS